MQGSAFTVVVWLFIQVVQYSSSKCRPLWLNLLNMYLEYKLTLTRMVDHVVWFDTGMKHTYIKIFFEILKLVVDPW